MHGKDVGREDSNGSAHMERMVVETLGFLPQAVRLKPGRRTKDRHEQQDGAHGDSQLRANFHIFQFHRFILLSPPLLICS